MKFFFIFTSHIPRIRNESHIISDCVLIDTFQIAKYYRVTQIFTNFVTNNPSHINGVTSEDKFIHFFYSHITLNLPSCSCSTFSSIMLARMFPCRNKLQSKSVIFPMVVTSSYLSLALIMLEHSMKEKVSWWLAKSATDTTR